MTSPVSSSDSVPPSRPAIDAGVPAWRVLLRMLAGLSALGVFAFWGAAGWNTGWTKDKIAIKQTDDLTGIDYVTYQDHFVPGIELLSLGLGLCVALFAITFIRRRKATR